MPKFPRTPILAIAAFLPVCIACAPALAAPPPQQNTRPPADASPAAPKSLWCDNVVELQTARGSGVTSVWLASGVRLHHLRLDRQPAQAVLTVALSGGKLLEDANNRGITEVAAALLDNWDDAAPDAARAEQMHGRNVRISARAGPDAIILSVAGSVSELGPGTRTLQALLTAPAVTPQNLELARESVLREIRQRAEDPRATVADALNATLSPRGEVRLGPPSRDVVAALTTDQVRAWLERHLSENGAPIEAAIVGDLSLADALHLADPTLGALPPRARVGPQTDGAARMIALPAGPVARDVAVALPGTGTQRATVIRGFLGPEMSALTDQRSLRAGARVAVERLKKRLTPPGFNIGPEGPIGGVYLSAFKGLGMVLISVTVAPEHADKTAEAIEEELNRLTDQGPTPEETDAVRAELAKATEAFERDPRYWSGVLARSDASGLDPDQIGAGAAYYRALRPETIRDTLRKFNQEEVQISVTIRPEQREEKAE